MLDEKGNFEFHNKGAHKSKRKKIKGSQNQFVVTAIPREKLGVHSGNKTKQADGWPL